MPLFLSIPPNLVVVQYSVPTTGQTVVMASNIGRLVLNPAGLLATLTLTVPPLPTNGQKVSISSTQAITAITINGGTIVGTITTLAIGGFADFVFSSDTASWLRAG